MSEWNDLSRMRGFMSSHNVALEQFETSSIKGWEYVKKTVERVAATECADTLNIVYNNML